MALIFRRSQVTMPVRMIMAFLALFLGAAAAGVQAQVPEEFTNLKVLPRDISKGELMGVMRGFAGSLGVRCNHCHVGPDNLQGMDFATDEKETKRTARVMMNMVRDLNDKYLPQVRDEDSLPVQVQCATCHRRQTQPRFIEDLVEQHIQGKGVEAGLALYREIRAEHYGGFAYDFSDVPLTVLAERLAASGDFQQALAVLRLNGEYHAESSRNQVLMAQVHVRLGEHSQARLILEAVLQRQPDNRFVQAQLERVKAAMGKTAGDS